MSTPIIEMAAKGYLLGLRLLKPTSYNEQDVHYFEEIEKLQVKERAYLAACLGSILQIEAFRQDLASYASDLVTAQNHLNKSKPPPLPGSKRRMEEYERDILQNTRDVLYRFHCHTLGDFLNPNTYTFSCFETTVDISKEACLTVDELKGWPVESTLNSLHYGRAVIQEFTESKLLTQESTSSGFQRTVLKDSWREISPLLIPWGSESLRPSFSNAVDKMKVLSLGKVKSLTTHIETEPLHTALELD